MDNQDVRRTRRQRHRHEIAQRIGALRNTCGVAVSTIGQIIAEPIATHGLASGARQAAMVRDLMDAVGLSPRFINRYPHEFSGGQRQRIAIARAMALEPRFVVLDEPTSALDMSVQAQIVDLLRDLQDQLGVAYVFISHDMSTVRFISDPLPDVHMVLAMCQGGEALSRLAAVEESGAVTLNYGIFINTMISFRGAWWIVHVIGYG